jgi:photosystem II stability/assembly factor-like uncharacterized protein
MSRLRPSLVFGTTLTLLVAFPPPSSGPVPAELLSGLVWRNVGPFRGGRISAAVGVIGEPGTFYAGTPAGGVWKTTSAGETWFPVFDSITTASSIGALDVAPSNSNVVYVGTGQAYGNDGDGVYRSSDAGKTWKHVGLESTKRIGAVIVDPRNAEVVLVGAQGGRAKDEARGVYRSTDGGATWTLTLALGDSIGVSRMAISPDRPDVVFATTRLTGFPPTPASGIPLRRPPVPPDAPTGAGLFKSVDGGVTWTELTGGGMPRFSGMAAVAVAMNTDAQRVYLITNDGLYRSDDGGTTWRQMDPSDKRIRNAQGGYNCGVLVDTRNPDIVYTFATTAYISTDGGETFTGFRGAPGGDDPQAGWIDPTDPRRMIFGFDQGAIVTFDRGGSWSSWYNQSTEQIYHLSIDNSFPYWIYASQQDAGTIRTRARGDLGAIYPFDWSPVSGWEWGTIVPDPLDHNTVYATGIDVLKIDMPTSQHVSVSPAADPSLRLRLSFSQPLVWAPWNQHELLAGFQVVMATTDGGAHWRKLSPDLTYPAGVTPPPDSAKPSPNAPRRGAIETMAASPSARGTIWVGTNNGLIKVTTNEGQTWADATIPGIPYPAAALIEKVEASPFVAGEAYAAVNVQGPGDDAPYLYRTRDYGKTWQKITEGLPDQEPNGSTVRVVRADPKRAGLLFAGTESGIHVSFDDGDHWQSLRLNLPTTSFRAIEFAGNDLVVGTYGRGIWILDDYAVLRQMSAEEAREPVHLFKPDPAVRVRRSTAYDTPYPLDVPQAKNPPDGAVIYYWLANKPAGEITIEVTDSTGAMVRHLSSVAAPPVKEAAHPNFPDFWLAEPYHLPAEAGTNRATWDLRYDAPPAFIHTFEINGNPGASPPSPEGALALPGTYTVKLTVDGKSYSSRVTVRNDPRSPATAAALRAQRALVAKMDAGMRAAYDGYQQVAAMRAALPAVADSTSDLGKTVKEFRAKLDSIGGIALEDRPFSFGFAGTPKTDLFSVHERLQTQFMSQESGDLGPTAAALSGFAATCRDLGRTLSWWRAVNGSELRALNARLVAGGEKAIPPAAGVPAPIC